MNIEIVNKEISSKLKIKEKDVSIVNKFYWDTISKHISSYNENPVNITGLCVIHPDQYYIKNKILQQIHFLRKIEKSKKFKENSIKKQNCIRESKEYLRKYLQLRKKCKFTN